MEKNPNNPHTTSTTKYTCSKNTLTTEPIINHLNSLLFKFLWHPNWIENIKRKKLTPMYEQGGLKMINIDAKLKTCRVERINN